MKSREIDGAEKEDKPNEKNTVAEIKSWLTENNISFNDITLKSDLLNLVNNVQKED
ncbi:hypothetical protein RV05_GL001634 [Enterococcus hirae]|uniref:HeH/LEM domain-containing protein n=1 Tax=Enterococcus hirae (strain ATCC 9790 / DSM 20160 / JCM 8729 / LMG 6399 / NBRC 3181 / NCIMB 6459 / NCDO 1258 / NCTC 12367 / WDCM 00089 / R) TaxID=768486 RepID=I6T7I0_ENTHA|nr:hypothetical protein EHR_00600 [Enterococcus hirae ATCC 9790]OJG48642.1 hypothetical protein RV05_GL001634 [Enterococcus hirae]